MTENEARAALLAAGADDVQFMDSFGHITGIKVEAAGKTKALRWDETFDGTQSAVNVLRDWLASDARPR